ncbi:MAG: transposase [Methylococcaceae bacterium]|nr:transposase [Methylococcaceae bacterium]
MPNYRRNRLPGGTYFFTVNLLDRKSHLLIKHINMLREGVRITKRKHPFHIDAWVVLPDHLHCIWTLPAGDDDYSGRWRAIKKHFSKAIPVGEYRSKTRIKRNERGVWQRRFWEHTIKDDKDYAAHMDYIHYNPVKHGWVETVKEWPYSTFHSLVEKGVYPIDWAVSSVDCINAGERD